MMKITHWGLVGLCISLFGCQSLPPSEMNEAAAQRERATAKRLDALGKDPIALRTFLKNMPKGADLHNHISGAVSTEKLIAWGAEDKLCIDINTWTAGLPPCKLSQFPMSNALTDKVLYKRILEAWSMEGFQGKLLAAHQHFFDAFGKYSAVLSEARADDALADILETAGKHRQLYVELMQGFGASQVGNLAAKYIQPSDPWTESMLLEKRKQLIADPVFKAILEKNVVSLKQNLQDARQLLSCDKPAPDLGCTVEARFLVSANRTKDRASVFAQWVYGYELAQATPLVVGVELVSPEEDANSLKYYDDEMFALDVLRRFNQEDSTRSPVRIALHAGELIPDVLPATPEGLAHLHYHIRHAVEIAHAERIGHGSDVLAEDQPAALLQTLHDADVMIEACLTSNAVLLGKEGSSHPINTYLEQDVPVALATDDEGILRNNITEEFVRAVIRQNLDYYTLKKMVRTSVEHSFLPGNSLWKSRYGEVVEACTDDMLGGAQPSEACASWLNQSKRAAMQWKLEAKLSAFEAAMSPPRP